MATREEVTANFKKKNTNINRSKNNNYNPYEKRKGEKNSLANDNIEAIREIARKNNVDMGVAKSMFETDIRNKSANPNSKRYGDFEITSDHETRYNKAVSDATANLTTDQRLAIDNYLKGNRNKNTVTVAGVNNNPNTNLTVNKPNNNYYQTPTSPQFKEPRFNPISYDKAVEQTQDQLDPIYQKALRNIQNQHNQNRLDAGETASARGLSHSGLAADQLNKLAIATQGNIANLNSDKASQVAQLAQMLVERDQNMERNLNNDAFNQWATTQSLNQSQQQIDWGKIIDQANLTGEFQSNPTLAALSQMFNQNMATEQFNYGKERDSIQDNQWQQQYDWSKILQQLQLNQNTDQFNQQMGYNYDRLAQDQQQFIDSLNSQNSNIDEKMLRAMELAQRDPRLEYSPELFNDIVKEYYGQLGGSSGGNVLDSLLGLLSKGINGISNMNDAQMMDYLSQNGLSR